MFKTVLLLLLSFFVSYITFDKNMKITDFDLPPVYNVLEGKISPQSVQVINDEIVSGFSEITKYPGKHWADNIGFELSSFTNFSWKVLMN